MADAPLSLIAWGRTETAIEKAEQGEVNHFSLRVSLTVSCTASLIRLRKSGDLRAARMLDMAD